MLTVDGGCNVRCCDRHEKLLFMLEVEFKSNWTPQNWLVRWGLHPTYIVWNCLISGWCGTSNPPSPHPSCQGIYISCVVLSLVDVGLPNFQIPPPPLTSRRYIYISCGSRNGWSVSGPIAGGAECPRNLIRIDSNLSLIAY